MTHQSGDLPAYIYQPAGCPGLAISVAPAIGGARRCLSVRSSPELSDRDRPACCPASPPCSPALASLAWPRPPATHYPLTVENCGKPQTFAQAPQRAVTIGQAGTEMLYALGLGDKLAGTSLWFNNVLPEYQAQNDKVPRLADNDPSFSRPWSASAHNW